MATITTTGKVDCHGPIVSPPWFNDLIQHGYDRLLNIVNKNLHFDHHESSAMEIEINQIPSSLSSTLSTIQESFSQNEQSSFNGK